MRDLDMLTRALRDRADDVEPIALLPGVRRVARRLRRRRQVAAMTAVVVAVGGVVGATAFLSRDHASRSAPASSSTAPAPSIAASALPRSGLTGNTWYVVSWEVAGKRGLPSTSRPPTLRFLPQDANSGKSVVSVFDGQTTTKMAVSVSPGPQMVAWGAGFSPQPATAGPVQEVDRVFSTVLAGNGGVELDPARLRLTTLNDSITLVSSPPPVGLAVNDLISRTWYLTSVNGNGRVWSPGAISTLTFPTTSTAQTDDGTNETSWVVTLTPHQVSWVQGESSLVGGTAVSFQISSVLMSVLKGQTEWSLHGGRLVFTGSSGTSLTYSVTRPPTPKPYSGALVLLDNNPPGGKEARGQSLNPISGQVTITDAQGKVAWSGLVTADDGGDSHLAPGPYTISAVVQGGTCTPTQATVEAGVLGEFDVVCETTQPTRAQP